MAKKKPKSASTPATPEGGSGKSPERGAKSAAVREYLKANKRAKPKEIVAALKAQGINVSTNLVSVIRATAGIKKAKRTAVAAVASHDKTATAQTDRSNGLEAALLLYKAARGQTVPPKQVTRSISGDVL